MLKSVNQVSNWRLLLASALLLWLVCGSATAADDRWRLADGFPADIEHGLQLMREPALQAAMLAYEQARTEAADSYLLILHGRDQSQAALAAQLRDWLLLLGMPADAMRLDSRRKLKQHLLLQIEQP